MKPSDTDPNGCENAPSEDTPLPFAHILREDTATLAEMLLTIVPVFAYCCVYFVRWRTFMWFGVSREFITIRLEDLLFVGITVLVLYWSQLANWLIAQLSSRKRGRQLLGIFDALLLIVLLVQAIALALLAMRGHVFNAYQFIMLGIQAVLFLLWMLASGKRWIFAHRDKASVVTISLVCALLFVTFSVGRAAYLVFHTSQYQVCGENNTLVVAYLEGGLAIGKDIVSMEEGGTCVLSPGYRLSNVEDKDLRLTHFSYIVAK